MVFESVLGWRFERGDGSFCVVYRDKDFTPFDRPKHTATDRLGAYRVALEHFEKGQSLDKQGE